jgi:hypothetical protein
VDTQLHVIYPAAEYVPGGTEALVALSCLSSGRLIFSKLFKVVLQITEEPFSVAEVPVNAGFEWNNSYVLATKIIDACTGDITYVKEYLTDVSAAAQCCLLISPSPPQPTVYYEYSWWWGMVDPTEDLEAGIDTLLYQGSNSVPAGTLEIPADYRLAPRDQYYVLRTPKELPIYNFYQNSQFIFGPILSGAILEPVWNAPFEVGDYRYFTTRLAVQFGLSLTNFSFI